MCFSASASFGASAVLAVAGFASIKKVQTRSQLMFACIPLVFSIQQFTEGFVWISMTAENSEWRPIPMYIFLVFAQVIWPTWVPLSILLFEKDVARKKILQVIFCLGLMLSCYLAYCLVLYDVSASIRSHHIHYDLDFPVQYIPILSLFYFIPTIVPPFISSVKKMSLLGLLNFASFLVTKLFFGDFIISVWCFFAALISGVVYLILRETRSVPALQENP